MKKRFTKNCTRNINPEVAALKEVLRMAAAICKYIADGGDCLELPYSYNEDSEEFVSITELQGDMFHLELYRNICWGTRNHIWLYNSTGKRIILFEDGEVRVK